MTKNSNKTAYIGIERDNGELKYTAKVFNESPREISKGQYNSIVKALGSQDWSQIEEDEASVISRIISDNLLTGE